MSKIAEIEGIGETYAEKLETAGITTVESLLEKCAEPTGRKSVANDTGISEKLVLRWANMADLFRIKGVGEEFSDLLEAAGVDTVPELAQRNAENLHAKLVEINEEKELTRRVPSADQVADFIAQAKELPRVLNY